ncbi:protein disulfide isomerase [Gracilibacillus halophilus YIM-C55.5]|uniref:Protein disulfide isomerase n=1 Tax=Gracilibacillus halophilus YIM-C55.5 TaxID=1308866 RepID=N4WU64_9BACI|nr:DsbA family oxidoreductase [Gracilibacillus halophilus]ENH97905.1 protein disulfide isomerase [Gracilibacillus halophilus YIM-C55.5]
MKIEIWSDFVCPFCYIGKRRLEQAIERYPENISVHIEYKSFELDPNAPTYQGTGIHESLAKKYGMSIEQAKQANAQIREQARSVGLEFVFDTMKPTNTFDVHRVAKYAKEMGVEATFTEEMLHQYFSKSKNLSDQETLTTISENIGLDPHQVETILRDSNLYANNVRADEAEAQNLGITGVPFFVINQKYAISGAQPTETFLQAIERVHEEEKDGLQDLTPTTDADYCDGDHCYR